MIVVWRITTRCNLSCAFCAYDKRVPGRRREVDAASVAAFAPVLANYSKQRAVPAVCRDCPSTQVFAKFASRP
jgi:MoaA/NifB/PqqE/SkfB family radical SAM enzyme